MTTLLTTAEAAKALGISPQRVRYLANAKRIKGRRRVTGWVFRESDLENGFERQRRGRKPKK